MRFVFVDEAGTSEEEPVTVVAGLTVHADHQLIPSELAITELLGGVPKQIRDGFVFHATDIWSNRSYRDFWSMADRLDLLEAMMALPRRLGIPISFGCVRRDSGPVLKLDSIDFSRSGEIVKHESKAMTIAQGHHVLAFALCLMRADKWVRDHAELNEVATVVAEDIPEMRRYLKLVPYLYQNVSVLPPAPRGVIPTAREREQGFVTQETDFRITRIRRSIHFVEKGEDLALFMADACAFGIRRWLSRQEHGERFIRAMLGRDPQPITDFDGPISLNTWRWK